MPTKPPALLTIQPQDSFRSLREFGRILFASTWPNATFMLTNES
jgi:hypothetical protein